MGILVTIFVFGFVVFVHEMGHLLFAKLGGIGVFEFSVGMGPKVAGFNYKGTDYNLRILPFGGFVRLAGLDKDEQECDEATYFQNRPIVHRFLTISAGSFMNVVFGFLLFFTLVMFTGIPSVSSVIDSVQDSTPAAKSGLLAGDKILSINNEPVIDMQVDFVDKLQQKDSFYLIEIDRNGVISEKTVTPYFDEEYQIYRLGVTLEIEKMYFSFFQAIITAFDYTGKAIMMVFKSIEMLFSGEAGLKDLSGPVGIVQVASFQFSQSFLSFVNLIAFISIALGVMNLFPIPILDGGHLVLLLIELIFKRPLPEKIVKVVSNIFAILLIGLTFIVLINDFRFWPERVNLLNEVNSRD